MPNMKNAKKMVKVNKKRTVENNNYEATMKTAMKKVEKAVAANDKEQAATNLKTAIKTIDKAAAKGVVSKNYVARNKSRLTNKVNEMK
ncbi:MAG TPA: 30S ribosomal protein S20 [Candidatus Fimihabitans intestinipullorum]|uniref:Small ribosomal subunit protein bS20 n=1 Tax=Candidatus Fimihabitans intestinipullorum TaxID=2840820 RepID=A0A9D1L4C0_9BACT|nr:30S ribosomal protein S20 [Candidatus Fimihabitans intestinipullorum]